MAEMQRPEVGGGAVRTSVTLLVQDVVNTNAGGLLCRFEAVPQLVAKVSGCWLTNRRRPCHFTLPNLSAMVEPTAAGVHDEGKPRTASSIGRASDS